MPGWPPMSSANATEGAATMPLPRPERRVRQHSPCRRAASTGYLAQDSHRPTVSETCSRREQQAAVATDVLRVVVGARYRELDDVEAGDPRHLCERRAVRNKAHHAPCGRQRIVASFQLD